MSLFFKKLLALILSLINCLIFSVSFEGDFMKPEKNIESFEIINDIDGDSPLSDSVKYGASIANKATGYYSTPSRAAYVMENKDITFTHSLLKQNSATITDKDGNIYIADSFNTYYIDSTGKKYTSDVSGSKGRVNAIRLGTYYYECCVRDFDFNGNDFKVDKTYHLYGDRLFSQLSLLACEATDKLKEFGSEIVIPKSTVSSVQIKDKNSVKNDFSDYDCESVEYVAFDIKSAGVIGFIVPSDGSSKSLTVTERDNCYIVTQTANYTEGTGINKFDETGSYSLNKLTFGFRIYTNSEHSFDGIDREAYLERNPLKGVTVETNNCNASFSGYDALRGTYTFDMYGTGSFAEAYINANRQNLAPITITCDDNDRQIFVRTFGHYGILEASRLLDENGVLSPLDVQVCKNFQGDGGEPFYSVKDYLYGDGFFPISLKKNETIKFTALHIFQNWGNAPLKQVSSIEFHTSYYHLSTGCTETNCFAPYFVGDKDGWTLPDFRTRSGIMWSEQPQFNSVGILKFMTYNNRILGLFDNKQTYSEYRSTTIDSSGLAYSDYTTDYLSDCGSFIYSLRHVEFPQTDENRTYFTIDVTFTKKVSFDNFRRDFDIFYYDGRNAKYDSLSYIGTDNKQVDVEANNTSTVKYYTLGNDAPFYTLYDVTKETEHLIEERFACNFALLIKDSKIVIGGEEQNIPFAVRNTSRPSASIACLTLDTKKIEFNPGDTIKLDIILLPWGVGNEETIESVTNVREDSIQNPTVLTAEVGTVIEDTFLPRIMADDGVAEFTVTGGRNNTAIRVDGFTSLNCPDVYAKVGDSYEKLSVASVNGYDGYTVHYNADGTYSFSFVYHAENPDSTNTFRISQ
ncbi:MAG: hypothetical protein IJB86_10880 [Clostridia bacterium]|nr:hypothetical protein [Clostridia bacterium]